MIPQQRCPDWCDRSHIEAIGAGSAHSSPVDDQEGFESWLRQDPRAEPEVRVAAEEDQILTPLGAVAAAHQLLTLAATAGVSGLQPILQALVHRLGR